MGLLKFINKGQIFDCSLIEDILNVVKGDY
jgi:hypothetical protein